ncbi:uncharacterized protein C2845_PM07G36000 [Panicum miliaceum]|uniref:Uncharacterized protein n=1 Tax=Panicum miliaceum TaxID=4540 RepID=A0A3L6SLI4_PANMI|nr:uncharacterized protein C2845_PM07G36000 [Panicum miliaceum]
MHPRRSAAIQLLAAHPGHRKYKRNQQLTCTDPKNNKAGCMARCEAHCPDQCIVLCPGCKTYCICDFYTGMSLHRRPPNAPIAPLAEVELPQRRAILTHSNDCLALPQ